MASARQLAANVRNAQKCTGPKTEEGKRASRMNALKHGMRAQIVVLPYEDHIEYHEIRAGLIEGYQPANNQELMLVDQIAAGYWRTMRARAYEVTTLTGHLECQKVKYGVQPVPNSDNDDLGTVAMLTNEPAASFDNYFRYDGTIERAYYQAINTLERLQARRVREARLSSKMGVKTAKGQECSEMGLVSFGRTDTKNVAAAEQGRPGAA